MTYVTLLTGLTVPFREEVKFAPTDSTSAISNIISPAGRAAIASTLRRMLYNHESRYWSTADAEVMRLIERYAGWEVTLKEKNRAGYSGRFAVRVSKLVGLEFDTKLSAEELASLGAIAKEYSGASSGYTVEFTDQFDWRDGDFGDGGSCFWGGRSEARQMLANSHGLAVLVRGATRGRCWLMPSAPTPDSFIVFNGYGMTSSATPEIANLLMDLYGLHKKKIVLSNQDMSVGTLWINDNRDKEHGERLIHAHGHGYALVKDTVLLDTLTTHDLNIADNNVWPCYSCGKKVTSKVSPHQSDGDESVVSYGVRLGSKNVKLCVQCRREKLEECCECGRSGLKGSFGQTYRGAPMCADCYSRTAECADCHERCVHYEKVDNKIVCSNCLDRYYCICTSCRKYGKNEHSHRVVNVGRYSYDMCLRCIGLMGKSVVKAEDGSYNVPRELYKTWIASYRRLENGSLKTRGPDGYDHEAAHYDAAKSPFGSAIKSDDELKNLLLQRLRENRDANNHPGQQYRSAGGYISLDPNNIGVSGTFTYTLNNAPTPTPEPPSPRRAQPIIDPSPWNWHANNADVGIFGVEDDEDDLELDDVDPADIPF